MLIAGDPLAPPTSSVLNLAVGERAGRVLNVYMYTIKWLSGFRLRDARSLIVFGSRS